MLPQLDETAETAPAGTELPDMGLGAAQALEAAAPGLPESLLRIPVTVQVVLGTARLPLSQVADLRQGSTITLDQKLGAPVIIMVNGKEVAKGELFVLDGEQDRLGVTITELSPAPRHG